MFNFGGGAGPGNSGMFQGALSSARGITPEDMNRLIEAYRREGKPLPPNLNPPQGTNPRPLAGGAGVGGLLGESMGNVAGISFDINESPKNRKMRGIRKLSETGTGGEKDAAIEKLKQMGGPQLPLAMGATSPGFFLGSQMGMGGGLPPMGNLGAMFGGMIGRGVVN